MILILLVLVLVICVVAFVVIKARKSNSDAKKETQALDDAIDESIDEMAGYTIHKDKDVGGSDIKCFTGGESVTHCKALCDSDPSCKAVNQIHPNGPWKEKSGCCYKKVNSPMTDVKGIDFYTKN